MSISENTWNTIFEKAPGIILIVDSNDRILFINQVVPGLSKQEVIGKNQFDYIAPHHHNLVRGVFERVRKTGLGENFEIEGVGQGDSMAWYSTQVERIQHDAGETLLALYTTDITDKRKAEQAWSKSDSIRHGLMQNIPGMTYRGNADWSVDIMQRCEELCGYTQEEISIKEGNWLAVIHPDDRETVSKEGMVIAEKPMSIVQQYRILTKDGETRWVEDRKTSFFDEGKFAGVDGILFDITERQQTEEELKRAKDALIERQREAIQELSTPVIQVWEEVLILPLIGVVDSIRAKQIMENLLEAIVQYQATVAILDVTGVPVIDTTVSDHLLKTIEAAKMLGAKVILTGVSPYNAQTLVKLGVDLSRVSAQGSLQQGLRIALEMTNRKIIRQESMPIYSR